MGEEIDCYLTVSERVRQEIKSKNSLFVATVVPVDSKQAAATALQDLRNELNDASHHCYAYRLGTEGFDFRFSDDGEPNGSAGKPILFMLQKYNVSDVLLTVSRYFGGTKLGIGGLARAYSDAAKSALETVELRKVFITVPIKTLCTYEDVDVVKSLVETYGKSFEAEYRDVVEYIVYVALNDSSEYIEKINAKTYGRAGVVVLQKE